MDVKQSTLWCGSLPCQKSIFSMALNAGKTVGIGGGGGGGCSSRRGSRERLNEEEKFLNTFVPGDDRR